jgi:hypothetical protein
MNIGSKFGKLRDVMNEVKNQNVQAPPAELTKAPTKPAPAELNPTETLTKQPKAGSASATLKHDPEAAIQAFQKASQGKQIPIAESKNPNDSLKSVLDFAKSKLGRNEMMNVFKFMGDIDSSKNSTKLGKAIQDKGLTVEQLDLIANGEFTAKDYNAMINQGSSAA